MYTIIDIETTGGNNKSGRITEIAAFLHNGQKLIDKFSTLVNPEIPIPPFIKNLTGITDEMVADAPTFAEISAELDRFTANSVFVAHNAGFDYGFVKEEFRRLGQDFKRKTLCTVRMSRRSFPDLKSYSLGKITAELDIQLTGHHRAEADALATVHLFEKIIDHQSQTGMFDAYFGVPDLSHVDSPLINRAFLDTIADEYGVARFYNREDQLIYAKRGAEVLTSICTKLKYNGTKNQDGFLNEVYRVDAEITYSPLLAQLIEANDVLENEPKYNHGRFSVRTPYALFFKSDSEGPLAVLENRKAGRDPKMVFGSFFEGLDYLKKCADKKNFQLFGVLQMSDSKKKQPVFIRTRNMPIEWALPQESMIVLDESGSVNDRVAILVKNGAPLGYSVVNIEQGFTDFGEDDLIQRFGYYPELSMVLRNYLAKGRYEKIIPLD